MEERINQALLQIENDLRDVQSARSQVETVVESCAQLQDKVGTFVKNVADLSKQTDELVKTVSAKDKDNFNGFKVAIDGLQHSCNDFLAVFNSDTKHTVSDFKNEAEIVTKSIADKEIKALENLKAVTSEIVSKFKSETEDTSKALNSENANLSAKIESLVEIEAKMNASTEVIKSLNISIESLMSELQKSQSAQDEDLAAIKNNISEQSTLIKNYLIDLSGNIGNQFSTAEKQIGKISSDIDNIAKTNAEQYKNVSEILGKISVNQAESQNLFLKNSDGHLSRLLEQFSFLNERNSTSEQKITQKIDNLLSEINSVKQTQSEIQKQLSNCEKRDKALSESIDKQRIMLIGQIVLIIVVAVLIFWVK